MAFNPVDLAVRDARAASTSVKLEKSTSKKPPLVEYDGLRVGDGYDWPEQTDTFSSKQKNVMVKYPTMDSTKYNDRGCSDIIVVSSQEVNNNLATEPVKCLATSNGTNAIEESVSLELQHPCSTCVSTSSHIDGIGIMSEMPSILVIDCVTSPDQLKNGVDFVNGKVKSINVDDEETELENVSNVYPMSLESLPDSLSLQSLVATFNESDNIKTVSAMDCDRDSVHSSYWKSDLLFEVASGVDTNTNQSRESGSSVDHLEPAGQLSTVQRKVRSSQRSKFKVRFRLIEYIELHLLTSCMLSISVINCVLPVDC